MAEEIVTVPYILLALVIVGIAFAGIMYWKTKSVKKTGGAIQAILAIVALVICLKVVAEYSLLALATGALAIGLLANGLILLLGKEK
ncbi:MAG: hypothetical protein NT067_00930 [Candidatus Diapherotrites archaeon]|nr:hypothetical protein [Candidatus Diapherotrites archaeon]